MVILYKNNFLKTIIVEDDNTYENIKWTKDPVKSLGLFYGHDKNKCQKLQQQQQTKNYN